MKIGVIFQIFKVQVLVDLKCSMVIHVVKLPLMSSTLIMMVSGVLKRVTGVVLMLMLIKIIKLPLLEIHWPTRFSILIHTLLKKLKVLLHKMTDNFLVTNVEKMKTFSNAIWFDSIKNMESWLEF